MHTQRQCGEVDGAAVGAVTPFISSSDLEGVDGTRNQGVDGHRVGHTGHAGCVVHIRTLRYAEEELSSAVCQHVCMCTHELR